MCGVSVHSRRARGVGGGGGAVEWCALLCSYSLCGIAAGLITLNVVPYHFYFLPQLRDTCGKGDASWVYYTYCLLVMLFAETMVYGNFALAIFTAPGFVPHEPWAHAPMYNGVKNSENPYEVYDLDVQGKLRYCAKCEQYKPDKAHHCSLCGHCVYRKDHHCPWINNCVGRDNSKYFLLFLAYIPVGAFHIVLTTGYSMLYHFRALEVATNDKDVVTFVVLVVSVFFSLLMGLAFAMFAAHFLSLSCSGQTSISKLIDTRMGGVPTAKTSASVSAAAAGGGGSGGGDGSRRKHGGLSERELHMYDIFGSDRRWWRLMFPFKPVRSRRDLLIDAAAAASPENGRSLLEWLV